ncbi:hypothetical protein BD289DRAFT_49207 [Coniella lustricola]|uniref:Uncharacterized protein n=1 Tax=Coniella lustricola TaxID=2025994 RepID=A0A2T3AIJ5_9PEZI|nr:hypothetical protein BD289DRAFT_49207 [Coniella lustricola]
MLVLVQERRVCRGFGSEATDERAAAMRRQGGACGTQVLKYQSTQVSEVPKYMFIPRLVEGTLNSPHEDTWLTLDLETEHILLGETQERASCTMETCCEYLNADNKETTTIVQYQNGCMYIVAAPRWRCRRHKSPRWASTARGCQCSTSH